MLRQVSSIAVARTCLLRMSWIRSREDSLFLHPPDSVGRRITRDTKEGAFMILPFRFLKPKLGSVCPHSIR